MLISYVLLLTWQAGGTTTALRFRHQRTLAPLSPFWRCFSICWRASKFDLLLPSCCCCSFSFSLTRTWLLWIKFLQQYDAFFIYYQLLLEAHYDLYFVCHCVGFSMSSFSKCGIFMQGLGCEWRLFSQISMLLDHYKWLHFSYIYTF